MNVSIGYARSQCVWPEMSVLHYADGIWSESSRCSVLVADVIPDFYFTLSWIFLVIPSIFVAVLSIKTALFLYALYPVKPFYKDHLARMYLRMLLYAWLLVASSWIAGGSKYEPYGEVGKAVLYFFTLGTIVNVAWSVIFGWISTAFQILGRSVVFINKLNIICQITGFIFVAVYCFPTKSPKFRSGQQFILGTELLFQLITNLVYGASVVKDVRQVALANLPKKSNRQSTFQKSRNQQAIYRILLIAVVGSALTFLFVSVQCFLALLTITEKTYNPSNVDLSLVLTERYVKYWFVAMVLAENGAGSGLCLIFLMAYWKTSTGKKETSNKPVMNRVTTVEK